MVYSDNDMTTQQLQEQLDGEMNKPEPDRECVMGLLKELESRTSVDPIPEGVIAAWKKFCEPQKAEVAKKNCAWKIAAIAAVLCLILTAVPPAFGAENVFQLIGRWTQDIFSFDEDPKPETFVFRTDNEGLQQLYDAVTDLGVTQNVVPTWLPEGYELDKLVTRATPAGTDIIASFFNGSGSVSYKLLSIDPGIGSEYQKDEDDVVIHENKGVYHYVFCNDNLWSATWVFDDFECVLTTENQEDLYKMVDSIYELED